jgi:hypothetical protein
MAIFRSNVNSVLIPMMVIGAVLFIVGVIGCCGAITGKSGLLNVYFVIVLIVVILELVIIILGRYTYTVKRYCRNILSFD